VNSYFVAPEAEGDLQQIWRYLLEEVGLAIANRIQGELVDVFFFSVYQYMIVYTRTGLVQIVAVLHGKRDVKRLLQGRWSSHG
jgi:plasmid stabilization system protein ParE